jgi:hypothetical protein
LLWCNVGNPRNGQSFELSAPNTPPLVKASSARYHPPLALSSIEKLLSNPGPAPVRSAVPRAAGANIHPILEANPICVNAHAQAADARDGRGRANINFVDAGRGEAAGEGGVAIIVELALVEGVVVGSLDLADGEVSICVRVSAMRGYEERGWKRITGWVDGAVGGDGHGILGWPAVESEMDGLGCGLTFVKGDGGGSGKEAKG